MIVGISLKSVIGAVLIVGAAALAGCSNAPATISGLASPALALDSTGPIAPENAVFAFEPFDGMPVNLGDTLTTRLAFNAATYDIKVSPRVKNDATYRVRGYIEASSDDTATIISYVYDIFDRNGALLHRLNGREIAGASFGDPWSAVSDGTIEQLAIRTLIDMRYWLHSQQ